MTILSPLEKLSRWRRNKARYTYVRNSLSLVHGPTMTRLADDEVALVILGRNMGYFLDHHIRHHLALGVSHIVYIDNGSTDHSIEIVKQFSNVTIAHCAASFRDFKGLIRYCANTLFLKGGWQSILTNCSHIREQTTSTFQNSHAG